MKQLKQIALLVLALGSVVQAGAVQAADVHRSAEDPNLVWTASQVVLKSKEMGPGVFMVYPDDAEGKNKAGIPVATSGGFIIGDDGVLVIDSMLNRRLATQLIGLIRAKTDKPIRYIVNTSYHGDHSYGNQFFPREVAIIQHEATQSYIQSHFADDVKFMSTYFGKNQGLDELRPRRANLLLSDGGRLQIDLGRQKVEVMHLGFAQTKGDLFVWAPQQKVMFTGNPVIAMPPALPWLLDGHMVESTATLKKLRTLLPENAKIVPGHGVPTDVSTLDFNLRYLDTLREQVQAAIDRNLSEKDTAATVQMDEFKGYKLFPWVHSQMNVVKAYQELKGQAK
ncbi:MBL fold metallo-hydrolase [Chitinimonas lacunae]|uniref:MBL fold metallo-hydrolase n=1 Tax=Chitinimonas lacunae TaxID=1963018 RepID=A0ABV8MKY2_9NEIS